MQQLILELKKLLALTEELEALQEIENEKANIINEHLEVVEKTFKKIYAPSRLILQRMADEPDDAIHGVWYRFKENNLIGFMMPVASKVKTAINKLEQDESN